MKSRVDCDYGYKYDIDQFGGRNTTEKRYTISDMVDDE